MYYSILHKTRFRYSQPVFESQTEVRMCPRTEGPQRLLQHTLVTLPTTRVNRYVDSFGNAVSHFDIPAAHRQLLISAASLVTVDDFPALPDALPADSWQALPAVTAQHDAWDYLQPSRFVHDSALLRQLAAELDVVRRADPLSLLRELNQRLARSFAYAPQTTSVDSGIDEALADRRGVCQDFAHIMLSLLRPLGLPARYVSGYLFHRREDHDRSEQDATHAWVEVLLPELGWVGCDPTNDLFAGNRHIRTAVGRDYADVPPTRGIFRGNAASLLEVGVKVLPAEVRIADEDVLPQATSRSVAADLAAAAAQQQAAQQQ
jgi:transglutaminase-like putative cysteine protease